MKPNFAPYYSNLHKQIMFEGGRGLRKKGFQSGKLTSHLSRANHACQYWTWSGEARAIIQSSQIGPPCRQSKRQKGTANRYNRLNRSSLLFPPSFPPPLTLTYEAQHNPLRFFSVQCQKRACKSGRWFEPRVLYLPSFSIRYTRTACSMRAAMEGESMRSGPNPISSLALFGRSR